MLHFRPYQNEGLRDIFEGWSTHDILMFILATGGGKTVTFMDVVRRYLLMGKRAMVIAHREELIMNTWQTLYDNKIFAGIIKGEHKTNYDLRTQVCSIQTIVRRKNLPPADLIVIDEGHHVTDDNSYANILLRYPNAKVLIVTATPYRLSGKGFQYIVPEKETKLILNRTLKQLQDEAWLVPTRYFIASIPDLRLANKNLQSGEYREDETEKAMKLAPLVDSYLEHAAGKQCIVFAINVHHSQEIVKQYRARGIAAEHIDATTHPDERKRIILAFRNKEIQIMSNVGIATEGLDIPNIECVQLARPTKSLSLFLQMIGRGTRALKGVVDFLNSTIETRAQAIANSLKPHCIILDNAGCWLDHGLPSTEIDWHRHFIGRKRQKPVTEEIEITVFVAENEQGQTIRTTNAQEVVGMRLIEVTHENKEKVINIKSLKEFDKQLAIMKNIRNIRQPGILALQSYIKFCNKEGYQINETCWNYIEDVLVNSVLKSMKDYEENCINVAGSGFLASEAFASSVKRIKSKGISKARFDRFKSMYEKGGAVAFL